MKRLSTFFLILSLLLILNACSVQTSTPCAHQYTAQITREATCSVEGEKTYTCQLCGDSKTEAISKTNHYYASKITTAATCKAEGVKTLTCSHCGDSKTESIAKLNHNYTSRVTTAATCKTTGAKTYTCSECGDSYTETISKTSHNYTSKVTTAATCSSNGTKTYTCKSCGDSYTETISATGHNWKAATCTAPKTCANCKTTKGTAKGHSYSNNTCVHCGQYNLTKLQEIKDDLDSAMESLGSAKKNATKGLDYADIGMDDSFLGLAKSSAQTALLPLSFDFPSIKLPNGYNLNGARISLRLEITYARNASSCSTFLERLASAEETLTAMQNGVEQLIAQQS